VGGKLIVVAGGQFGSEGKGAVTDQLTRPSNYRTVGVRVAGPNAGHVVLGRCPSGCAKEDADHDRGGHGETLHRWKLRSVPVAAVSNEDAELIIAAGSEVDYRVLEDEVVQLNKAGYNVSNRLDIDAQATVLTQLHIGAERDAALNAQLGSTAKGIGAARSSRIWRDAEIVGPEDGTIDTAGLIYRRLEEGWKVVIEGTQGFGLGLHAGFYPKCTTSDCRALDFLAMAGVSPWHHSINWFEPWVVARVRPIRVAGNSGPLKGETTWEALGLPEERTTVTNLVRRVGEWDGELVAKAIEANGGYKRAHLALTMVDTMFPEIYGVSTTAELDQALDKAGSAHKFNTFIASIWEDTKSHVRYIGTSPNTGVFV
jgi:adenylosuccinate synthase